MVKKTVLLVDDDVDFLDVNREALLAAGYDVIVAHDAEEALGLAPSRSVDVAVLDVVMTTPDEGFRLARSLRSNLRTRSIPIIMLTSINSINEAQGHTFRYSDKDRDPMWMPIDRFLDNPIRPSKLVEVIRDVVRS